MASSAFHPAFHGGIALVAAALVGAAPSPSAAADAPAAARHEIVIQGLQYVPETLHVRRGDVVVWRNKDPFPHTATADDLVEFDGVVLSNGPGDPEPLVDETATVREVLGRVPVLGICLGHQLLGLATGHSTFKLRFGHRGAQPCCAPEAMISGRSLSYCCTR